MGHVTFLYGDMGIAMELMHSNLKNALENSAQMLKTSVKIECCLQIARGLLFLHENQLLHRDLAARNCLLLEGFPDSVHIKLSDYCLSETVEKSSEAVANNRRGILWQAREVYLENKHSVESDIWSYGVTMWEIFSNGRTPYKGVINIDEYLVKNLRLPHPENCNDDIFDLMYNCWNLDPINRPKLQNVIDKLSCHI